MKTILLHADLPEAHKFEQVLAAQELGFHVIHSPKATTPAAVEVAVIWLTVPDYSANLKLILVCGSGVDHLIHAATLPRRVSLVRLADPFLRDRVSEYIVRAMLNHVLPSEGPLRPRGCISAGRGQPRFSQAHGRAYGTGTGERCRSPLSTGRQPAVRGLFRCF
jgi:hypothetical protein